MTARRLRRSLSLASVDIEGFPSAPEVPAAPEPDQPTEAEIRQKREQEERELIMDRLNGRGKGPGRRRYPCSTIEDEIGGPPEENVNLPKPARRRPNECPGAYQTHYCNTVFFLLTLSLCCASSVDMPSHSIPCLWTHHHPSITGKYHRLCWNTILASFSPPLHQNHHAAPYANEIWNDGGSMRTSML